MMALAGLLGALGAFAGVLVWRQHRAATNAPAVEHAIASSAATIEPTAFHLETAVVNQAPSAPASETVAPRPSVNTTGVTAEPPHEAQPASTHHHQTVSSARAAISESAAPAKTATAPAHRLPSSGL